MNDRIDWSDGSFEFVTKHEIETMPIKQYLSANSFAMCKYCSGMNCESYKPVAEEIALKIFNEYFEESLADEGVLYSKLKDIAVEFKKTLEKNGDKSACACACAFIQLLQLIDEETEIDITDELGRKLNAAFAAEMG